MNIQELIDATNSIIDDQAQTGDLIRWFNDALNRVGKDVPVWDTTNLTLTKDVRRVDLPARFVEIDELLYENKEYDLDYKIRNNQIVANKPFDATLTTTLDYFRMPALLTVANMDSEPELPGEYHWILTRYAAAMYKAQDDVSEDAEGNMFMGEFMTGWREMTNFIASKQGARRIKVVY